METVYMPELLPRPDYSKTYRKPLEYFVGNSIVIIVGTKKDKVTGRDLDLYEDCRIFTVLTERSDKQQKKVFEEKPILDHLWIPNKCNRWNPLIGVPNLFCVGKIQWYKRKDGSRDLHLVPINRKEHLESLFVGIVFIYGLRLIEEATALVEKGVMPSNYSYWTDQIEWLRLVTKKFGEVTEKLKLDLERPLVLKCMDMFLNRVTRKTVIARNHIKKMEKKKGFQKKVLTYI